MKNTFRIVLIAAACFVTLWVIISAPPPQIPMEVAPPPEFTMETLDDQKFALSDFTGKTTIIHFWASWCKPCVIEFPELVSLAKQHPETLEIIAISSDEKAEDITQFIAKTLQSDLESLPDNLHFVHDTDKSITQKRFQTYSYPESYIIDCDHIMREKIIGMERNWPEKLKGYLAMECPSTGTSKANEQAIK